MVEKVCVIGAGASGLAAAKALVDESIPFDWFEKGSQIGGLWRYENDNGVSPAYESLRINTWKGNTAYTDLPMPDDYPDYPDHRQMAAYFDAYADRFDLRKRVTFRAEVTGVRPESEGEWTVTLRDGRSERYRAVLVANGHHWDPRRPDFEGRFDGTMIHSHEYRKPDLFRDRRVLVVGIGNSGVDIACDVAGVARQTFIATRRGAHFLPRYLAGMPIDKLGTGASSLLPLPFQRAILATLLWIQRGTLRSLGLPKPDHKLLNGHPTVSSELPRYLREGRVRARPNLKELAGDRVRFADGTEEAVDVIVLATGYRLSFPFLDGSILGPQENGVPLYHYVVHPDRPGLYFIGLIQLVRGSIPRAAELQSKWIAGVLKGRLALPRPGEMREAIERNRREIEARFVRSSRHLLEADWRPYLKALGRERRRVR